MIIKHRPQILLRRDKSRFIFVLAGRRGGKTFFLVEDILETISKLPRNAKIVYIGPSLGHAKELCWDPVLERAAELGWYAKPHVSNSIITFSKNRQLHVLGAEKISRVRGKKYFKAYLDEIAYFTQKMSFIWRAIRPTLSDYRGGAVLATTPNGKGTPAYDFYLDILGKKNWSYHYWKTSDNPFIDRQEIEDAKQELDEKSFLQEYEAEWQSFEGVVYYSFDDGLHVKEQPPIDLSLPLHLCFDFNVNPTTLLLSQFDGSKLRYKKEYSKKHSSTEATVEDFCRDFAGKSIDIRIRGDAAGSARKSNTGFSDYHYVQEILTRNGFKHEYEVRAANPAIVDRLKVVNSWLKPYIGAHKVEIDPSCKDLIRDLSSQEMIGRMPSDKNNLGHKADAFGYDIYWQNMVASTGKSSTRIL
jgi:hypothetical protein